MNLKKTAIRVISKIMVFAFIFSIVGMPISEVYAATYAKSLTKTVTLKKGETVYWTLASKGEGELVLTIEELSIKGVKDDEMLEVHTADDYDEYFFNLTDLKEGKKETLGAYAMKSQEFGAFANVTNRTSGTVKIKIKFKMKNGKKVLKTKEYKIINNQE
jgi:hypothetical protein